MFVISTKLHIPRNEIEITPIRAGGPGGQNVNKVSTAVHLRFDIPSSSLPEEIKERLAGIRDRRISTDGIVVIKAQRFRSQEKNIEDALERLKSLILKATVSRKMRKPTRPTRSSKTKRVDEKTHRGKMKKLRGRVEE